MPSERQPLLEGHTVSKYFGGLAAVNNVDFSVYPGEIVGLIGPNGSGKTTLFDCLSRLQKIDGGRILFRGRDVTRARPYQIARMGLTRTFQSVRVYRKMSVLSNMLISHQWRDNSSKSISGSMTIQSNPSLASAMKPSRLIAQL